MSISRMEREQENQTLALVLEEIRRQQQGLQATVRDRRGRVVESRRWMWENLPHQITSLEDWVEVSQHQSELNRQEQDYLSSQRLASKLEKMSSSPYFGRIDFKEAKALGPSRQEHEHEHEHEHERELEHEYEHDRGPEPESEQIYIGIGSLREPETSMHLVYDWRAPICSMFYDFTLGPAEYICPEGVIQGEVCLKRQYRISEGRLDHVFDITVRIGDEILQEMLSRSADGRMKTIVASIQREQNQIIRHDRQPVVIVQGPAGSGKTSIALQRAAYLLYRHRETMTSQNIMMFSPNRIFSDYISGVLPELGEENVLQATFQAAAEERLGPAVRTEDMGSQMEYLLTGCREQGYGTRARGIEFKASHAFARALRSFAEHVKEGDELQRADEDGDTGSPDRHADAPGGVHLLDLYSRLFRDESLLGKLVKKATGSGRRRPDQPRTYGLSRDELEAVRRQTLGYLEGGEVPYEDLAPLLYLQGALYRRRTLPAVRHVIIDEAQDYSPLQCELMKLWYPQSGFTVLGDLDQSIRPYAGIQSYETLVGVWGAEHTRLFTLRRSYRSTRQIVEFAGAIISRGDSVEGVDRHGPKPEVMQVPDEARLNEAVIRSIHDLKRQGMRSIAVVCKTAMESLQVFRLVKEKVDIGLITKGDEVFRSGIVVIPSYLTKGLEFDAVLVYNAAWDVYGREADRKLFYTLCTRALHRLGIYYVGRLSPFVAGVDPGLYEEVSWLGSR